MVRVSDLQVCNREVAGSSPGRSASRNDSGQVVHTQCAYVHQAVVPASGWEGNRRSGVTLAMRHRLSGISTYGLNGLVKGDEHPA